MPRALLLLASITNFLQGPYKKKILHIVREGLPTQPHVAYLYTAQLIKKEMESVLSPKILIELFK